MNCYFSILVLNVLGLSSGSSGKVLSPAERRANTPEKVDVFAVTEDDADSRSRDENAKCEHDAALKRRCDVRSYKSILHGRALASSVQLDHLQAQECCQCAGGFDELLSLADYYSAKIVANSRRVKFEEPYHVYTKKDESGSYMYAQGGKIPSHLMSNSTYSAQLQPGDCLFAVIEVEDEQRVTKYVTGDCSSVRPFLCMRIRPEELFNLTCNVSSFYESLKSAHRTPSDEQIFHLSQQNRLLAKASIRSNIDGWTPTTSNPVRAYELAVKTFEVYRAFAPVSVIPDGFLTKTKILFTELNSRHGSVDKTDFLTDEDVTRISALLTKCSQNLPNVSLAFNDCGTMVLGTLSDYDYETITYICPKLEFFFNPFVSDPVFHVTQNVFQTVRNLCFPTFKDNSIKMFHRWQLAINDCFTPLLEDRWYYSIEPCVFWGRLLGPQAEEKLHATDAIALAVVEKLAAFASIYPRGAPPDLRMDGV